MDEHPEIGIFALFAGGGLINYIGLDNPWLVAYLMGIGWAVWTLLLFYDARLERIQYDKAQKLRKSAHKVDV